MDEFVEGFFGRGVVNNQYNGAPFQEIWRDRQSGHQQLVQNMQLKYQQAARGIELEFQQDVQDMQLALQQREIQMGAGLFPNNTQPYNTQALNYRYSRPLNQLRNNHFADTAVPQQPVNVSGNFVSGNFFSAKCSLLFDRLQLENPSSTSLKKEEEQKAPQLTIDDYVSSLCVNENPFDSKKWEVDSQSLGAFGSAIKGVNLKDYEFEGTLLTQDNRKVARYLLKPKNANLGGLKRIEQSINFIQKEEGKSKVNESNS